MQTVTVIHLIAGHITEAVHTGHRVTVHRTGEQVTVKIHGEHGRVTRLASYAHCPVVIRDTPAPEEGV